MKRIYRMQLSQFETVVFYLLLFGFGLAFVERYKR
jgi:hypothetical protein